MDTHRTTLRQAKRWGTIRAESEQDAAERERIYRSNPASEGWYRRQSRSKLRGNPRS